MPFLIWAALFANIASPILSTPLAEAAVSIPTPQDIWVQHLHECENPTNSPRILDTNNKYSYGYVSFQMATWLAYSSLGATKENISDDDMQRQIAEYILQNHGWHDWWNCGRVTIKWYGPYPALGK